MNLTFLVLLSCVVLCGLGMSALFVVQYQARSERLQTRFVSFLEPHARPRTRELPPLVLTAPSDADQSLPTRVLRLFGIDRTRVTHLPVRWFVLLAVALIVAYALTLVAKMVIGVLGLLLLLPLWIVISRFVFGWFARRHMKALFRQFPDALAMIVRSVRIGVPVSQAVGVVAKDSPLPTAAVFAGLSDAIAIGKPLSEAMIELAERNGLPEYRFFAAALSLQSQTGGGLAATLENLADVIRKRVHAQAKGYALAAEARMSALVLTALPVLTFFILLLISPAYIRVLIFTSAGQKVFGLALALLGFGQFCMRTLIRKSLS